MTRTCTVCRSEQLPEIDEAIISGVPQRQIADAYRSSPAAVQRHAASHLSERAKQASYRREDTRYAHLADRMAALADEGEQVLREAKDTRSDQRLVLAAMKEVRETLTTLMKVSQPQISDPEVEVLVGALGKVLPRFPETANALAEELAAAGANEVADVVALASA